jgi:endonuclease/exonuclease/phosphatase family metal-dependent hydrolase
MPVTNPMGKVESGIMTFSRFEPTVAQRYSFPLNYSWPTGLFMLDRCFILERFKLPNGKELVIVNTHNSAFDDAGVLRQYELWMLRGFLLSEYEKGNYVIAGGDWNQNPCGFNDSKFKDDYVKDPKKTPMEKDYLPATWHWCFDPLYPTNRNVNDIYKAGKTLTTIIDFFVASPNIKIDTVCVVHNDFEYSDHQPVYMKVKLIEDPVKLSSPECQAMIMTMQDSIRSLNDYMDKRFGKPKKPVQKSTVAKKK